MTIILSCFPFSLPKESSSGTTDQEPHFRLPTQTLVTIRTLTERQIPTDDIKERATVDSSCLNSKQTILPADTHLSNVNLTGRPFLSENTGNRPVLRKNTLQSCLLPDMSDMVQRSTSRSDIVASNPWQNLVKEFDPDDTMEDGRSYVGKASHLVDRPVAPRGGGRGGYGGYSGPSRDTPRPGPAVLPQRPRPPPQPQRQTQPPSRGPPS